MTDPSPVEHKPRGLVIRGFVLLHPLDLFIGSLVLAFFVLTALARGGDVPQAALGGLGIMIVMFVVGAGIEIIIDALRDIPGLGTVVGFITNGPEMLCLAVGLLGSDIIFAASTPLGSNFMNPIMLLAAGLVAGRFLLLCRNNCGITAITLGVTAALAASFFALPKAYYPAWIVVTLATSIILFIKRPGDPAEVDDGEGLPRWAMLPAILLVMAAGYFLDPVVTYTSDASHAHKGVIGFVVLAALTSWPEFRSCLGLLRRGRTTSAVLNITVSNITNLWLAVLGVIVYMATS